MATELLLDTSALVSLLDRSQRHHRRCVQAFKAWRFAVVSTEAVLTEATHLLGRVAGGQDACLAFFVSGGATLVPASPKSLARARALMKKYRDQPMDYTDASLVCLAEELGTPHVFTLDRDFGVYRIRGRRAFQTVP